MYENGQLLYSIVHRRRSLSSLPPLQREKAVLHFFTKHFIFHFNFISLINNNTTSLLLSKHSKFLNSCFQFPLGDLGGTYSVLKLFTGFAIAAFIAWKLMLTSAIIIETSPPAANTHQLILMR